MRGRRPPVAITGVGLLSPLADCPRTLHRRLAEGASGLQPLTSFPGDGLPVQRAAELNGFSPENYLGEGNLRPLDRTSRLAAAAAKLALEAGGWTPELAAEQEVGLVLGTMFGSARTIFEFDRRALTAGPGYVKPFDFANSVINAAAGQAAIWHGLRGVNATVAGGVTAGLQALCYADDLLRGGRARTLLAGGADELCFESFFGFCRQGLVAGSNGRSEAVAVPFHSARGGFVPGEGAALLLLEEVSHAAARGGPVLGEIRGHGACFDTSRGRDPGASAGAMARAVRLALDDAGVTPARVVCWSASASGRRDGDRAEAAGVAEALGDVARELPVLAVKGQLGEALGASGAFQTVAALQSLRCGRSPGIADLDRVEEGFPFPLAGEADRPLASGVALITALGLDGDACALVLGPAREGG